MRDSHKFSLLSINDRPLMLLPNAPRVVRLGAIECYPTFTRKRRIFKGLLRGGVWIGLPLGKSFNNCRTPLDTERVTQWLAFIENGIKLKEWFPVFVWPADPMRGRVYAFILDAQGKAHAFGKFALNKENSDLIRNETRALKSLKGNISPIARVPRVLAAEDVADDACQLLEFIPKLNNEAFDVGRLHGVLQVVQGRLWQVQASQVKERPWWRHFCKQEGVPTAFLSALTEAMEEDVCVCRVHGDMNRTNLLLGSKSVCLLDWERSDDVGPCLADKLALNLDLLWSLLQRKPSTALLRFQSEHWADRDVSYRNMVILALAFLVGAEFTPAVRLVQEWYKE